MLLLSLALHRASEDSIAAALPPLLLLLLDVP